MAVIDESNRSSFCKVAFTANIVAKCVLLTVSEAGSMDMSTGGRVLGTCSSCSDVLLLNPCKIASICSVVALPMRNLMLSTPWCSIMYLKLSGVTPVSVTTVWLRSVSERTEHSCM